MFSEYAREDSFQHRRPFSVLRDSLLDMLVATTPFLKTRSIESKRQSLKGAGFFCLLYFWHFAWLR